jgi:hypothetical protein
MYLFLIVWAELYFLWTIPWQISIGLIAFYMLWYLDGKEYNGERRWEAFRTLRLWKWISPVEIVLSARNDLQSVRGKRVFVFVHAYTPSSLIWSIGLHGGVLDFKNKIHYMVPPLFMWIPIVRDVMLWSGAITYSNYNEKHSKQTILLDMIAESRSVAYVPSGFADKIAAHDDLETGISMRYPKDDALEMFIKEGVQVIPVGVQGEFERYRIVQNKYVRSVQAWFYKHLDVVFPLLYWYRLYSHSRPPPVTVQFGSIMAASVYTSPAQLRTTMKETIDALLTPTPLNEKEIKNT